MAKRRPKGEDQAAQHLRFKEAARALGCDEDEAAFKAKLAVIGRQKPKDIPEPRAPKKDGSGD